MMWTGGETFASSTCWSFPAAVLCEESLAMDFYPFLCAKVSVTLPRATLRSWLILKPFVGIFSIWVNSSVPVTAQLTEQLHGRGSWKSSVGLLGLFSLTQPEKGTFHPSIKGCRSTFGLGDESPCQSSKTGQAHPWLPGPHCYSVPPRLLGQVARTAHWRLILAQRNGEVTAEDDEIGKAAPLSVHLCS